MFTQERADGRTSRLTVKQSAQHLGCSERTIHRMIQAGELPAERIGRMIRIKAADLEALGTEVNPPDPIREAALRVVSTAPKLTPEQLDGICSLLRGA
jgi:excisionase family DNA binding protein